MIGAGNVASRLAPLSVRLTSIRQSDRDRYGRFFTALGARMEGARAVEREPDRLLARRFNALDYFDLLERTLRSLLPRLDGPNKEILIVADSGDRAVHNVIEKYSSNSIPIIAIVNDPPIGQISSIDRLYDAVSTDWVFHCEDDWEFVTAGFIESSFSLLMEDERLSMVALRDVSEYGQVVFGPVQVSASGIPYRVAADRPRSRSHMCGIHFNPGLRRMADYRRIGPYKKIGSVPREVTVSEAYRDAGYHVGLIAEPAVRHIGDERSVRDPFQLTGFLYRMKRSARKRLLQFRDRLEGTRC